MDVELYVYDLSQGLARQYSQALTGVQIDAIYHTSIVYSGVEYFFGQGVHRKVPGSTHHGRPMKVVSLGRTELPHEVVEEYVQSLESIYTAESYDLFLHNCNNFTQDLAMFMVGKSIPDEIRNLPETFLRTPIGQMLRGQLDSSMRQMTQAPDAFSGQDVRPKVTNGTNGVRPITANSNKAKESGTAIAYVNGNSRQSVKGRVLYPQNLTELNVMLKKAEQNCAVIFFTSATCPPCKMVYPAYDELAGEAGDRASLIKIDISRVYDIARHYQVRATPTFMTFIKGEKQEEWSGAHEARLRGNVRLLVEMANPQHAHTRLNLPSLNRKIQKPMMYSKLPPIDKLLAKIGSAAKEKEVSSLVEYINRRDKDGLVNTAMPDLHLFGDWLQSNFDNLSQDIRFPLIDLVRIAAIDTRVSSFFAAEDQYRSLKKFVPEDIDFSSVTYSVQVVTLQLFCNLFASTIFQEKMTDLSSELRGMVQRLASGCLLAEHHNARSLAAALVYNLAAYDHNQRLDGATDEMRLSDMDELEAALVDAVVNEKSNKETLHALLLALGLVLFASEPDSVIWDLCAAMEVRESLKSKAKMDTFLKEPLLREVGEELLAKGRP